MRKHPLTLSLTKPREKAEAVLKTSEMSVYADITYIDNLVCENVLKMASP
jgi:hypothetical protein